MPTPTTDLVIHEFGTAGAPSLLLLHGFTDAGTNWPDAVSRWGADWHLVAPDQRGHGRSPRFTADQRRHTSETWLADTIALLEGFDEPVGIVGHSMGAALAVLAADLRPDLVRALVLEDPPRPVAPGPGTAAHDRTEDSFFVDHQLEFLAAFASGPEPEIARMRVETQWSDAEIAAWAETKPLVDPDMVPHTRWELPPAVTWEDVLNRLTVPTLLVSPADGGMAPNAADITNPLVRIVRVPGVSHCMRRDDPYAYHGIVDPFLREHAIP